MNEHPQLAISLPDRLPDAEAAWVFFGGVFKVLIPDNAAAIVADADAVNPVHGRVVR